MPRRSLALLVFVATVAAGACNSAPAAPLLTDPKEILVKSVTSLQEVKTVSIKGTFGGSIVAEGMGNFDLSTVKLDMMLDVPGKKARIQLDAPTLLGTNIDLIMADQTSYWKVVGPLASELGAPVPDKYWKVPAGADAAEMSDPTKAIEGIRKSLNDLPKAPEKLADERVGDQDCYHVRLAFTAEDVAGMLDGVDVGPISFDLWTRKNDLRPAKVTFSVDAGTQGNVTGMFEFTYDKGVRITAPPADQVVG